MAPTAKKKLPRCIQLDVSDTQIFKPAAMPGEWAIAGPFMFDLSASEAWSASTRLAFAQGFLGIDSFGWSTFVSVSSLEDAEVQACCARLAGRLRLRFPSLLEQAAQAAAQEEMLFAEELCEEHAPGQLLAVERDLADGKIVERFRAVARPQRLEHDRVWQLVPDDDDQNQ